MARLSLTAVLVLSLACGGTEATRQPEPVATPEPVKAAPSAADAIAAAVAHPARPDEDRKRDADRKPAEVLGFFGLEPGMKVAELQAGRGYYTEILARAIGPQGQLLVHNSAFVRERFAEGPISERLARLGMDHVRRADSEIDALELPAGELDMVLLVLFYHDTYWQKVDRPAMLAGIWRALEPGGTFALIDHHAQAGSGARDVETLHRVDAALVRSEVEAAGFVLDGESEVLRHPEDDRTLNVFDPAIRGKTDRFVYRFRKP